MGRSGSLRSRVFVVEGVGGGSTGGVGRDPSVGGRNSNRENEEKDGDRQRMEVSAMEEDSRSANGAMLIMRARSMYTTSWIARVSVWGILAMVIH